MKKQVELTDTLVASYRVEFKITNTKLTYAEQEKFRADISKCGNTSLSILDIKDLVKLNEARRVLEDIISVVTEASEKYSLKKGKRLR